VHLQTFAASRGSTLVARWQVDRFHRRIDERRRISWRGPFHYFGKRRGCAEPHLRFLEIGKLLLLASPGSHSFQLKTWLQRRGDCIEPLQQSGTDNFETV